MFEQLLETIGAELDKSGIPYMIIGGQAVLLYGEPRLTRDIDITLGLTVDGLDDVLAVAKTVGLRPLVEEKAFTVRTNVLPCRAPDTDIRVDFIFSFSPYEEQALKRVRTVRMGDVDVRFASPEDLIVHKVFAGRPRDLEDVKNVMIKNPDVDIPYIKKWLRALSEALGEPFLERFQSVINDLQE
jgi:predicted nucleotidyltransferase